MAVTWRAHMARSSTLCARAWHGRVDGDLLNQPIFFIGSWVVLVLLPFILSISVLHHCCGVVNLVLAAPSLALTPIFLALLFSPTPFTPTSTRHATAAFYSLPPFTFYTHLPPPALLPPSWFPFSCCGLPLAGGTGQDRDMGLRQALNLNSLAAGVVKLIPSPNFSELPLSHNLHTLARCAVCGLFSKWDAVCGDIPWLL